MTDAYEQPTKIAADTARALLPPRPDGGHKGSFGHVVVIAGSRGFAGAVRLACEAAYRAGAGLVTAAVPQAIGDLVAGHLVEAMTHYLPDTDAGSIATTAVEPLVEFLQGKKAAVIGPGLSQHADTVDFVHAFLPRCPVPTVVDADGLNALAQDPGVFAMTPAPCILTPHPGEMARLTGLGIDEIQMHREEHARELAESSGCVVVLKGAATVVADPSGEVRINTTGNSGMGTGGTGDVLSGILGGLLAQGITPFDAACLGVFIHGRAGDLAADAHTRRALIARDLIAFLPTAWDELEQA